MHTKTSPRNTVTRYIIGAAAIIAIMMGALTIGGYIHPHTTHNDTLRVEGNTFAHAPVSFEPDAGPHDDAAIGPHQDWDIEANSNIKATIDIWMAEHHTPWSLRWMTADSLAVPHTIHIHNATITEAIYAMFATLDHTTISIDLYPDSKIILVHAARSADHPVYVTDTLHTPTPTPMTGHAP